MTKVLLDVLKSGEKLIVDCGQVDLGVFMDRVYQLNGACVKREDVVVHAFDINTSEVINTAELTLLEALREIKNTCLYS